MSRMVASRRARGMNSEYGLTTYDLLPKCASRAIARAASARLRLSNPTPRTWTRVGSTVCRDITDHFSEGFVGDLRDVLLLNQIPAVLADREPQPTVVHHLRNGRSQRLSVA